MKIVKTKQAQANLRKNAFNVVEKRLEGTIKMEEQNMHHGTSYKQDILHVIGNHRNNESLITDGHIMGVKSLFVLVLNLLKLTPQIP